MEETADALTTHRVGLEDVDGTRLEQAAKMAGVEAVLACRDVHSARSAVAEKTKALDVARRA